MRAAISKKIRFDVFKRDLFKCQYCGATPPGKILEIDHIHPVASGGGSEIDNLITSCFDCNRGKGARLLECVPKSLKDKATELEERESQIRGYSEIMAAARDRKDDELWLVAAELFPGDDSIPRDCALSISRFNDKLGVYEVLEAAEIARAKFKYGGKRTFLYFCGVCHSKIKEKAE